MMNMVSGDDTKYFITDINFDENELIVTFADGTVQKEKFSSHNLQFYRHRMVMQAIKNLPGELNYLNLKSYRASIKKYAVIIVSLIGLYLTYNIDIHLVIKIILSILIILANVGHYIYSEIVFLFLSIYANEGLATDTYLKNLHVFEYVDDENKEYRYIVPPEDIARYNLTSSVIEELKKTIEEFEGQGVLKKDINLSYNKVKK